MIVGCIPDRVPATTDGPAASSATPRPSRVHPLDVPPLATGAPSRAFTEFLARVNGDRTTVDTLDGALQRATDARDLDAVHKAAAAILHFVDVEQAWLNGHPPVDCYADAHGSATVMLGALGTAAGRFVEWSAAGGGLDGLVALGRAADAAQTAQDALATFGTVLGGTACPA